LLEAAQVEPYEVAPQVPVPVVPIFGTGVSVAVTLDIIKVFSSFVPTVVANRFVTQYFAFTSPVCQSMHETAGSLSGHVPPMRDKVKVKVRVEVRVKVRVKVRGHVPPMS